MELCSPFPSKYRHKPPEPLISVFEIFTRWLSNRKVKCFRTEMRQLYSCLAVRMRMEEHTAVGIIYVQTARATLYSNVSVLIRTAVQWQIQT
jgi:hypothetical protein